MMKLAWCILLRVTQVYAKPVIITVRERESQVPLSWLKVSLELSEILPKPSSASLHTPLTL